MVGKQETDLEEINGDLLEADFGPELHSTSRDSCVVCASPNFLLTGVSEIAHAGLSRNVLVVSCAIADDEPTYQD